MLLATSAPDDANDLDGNTKNANPFNNCLPTALPKRIIESYGIVFDIRINIRPVDHAQGIPRQPTAKVGGVGAVRGKVQARDAVPEVAGVARERAGADLAVRCAVGRIRKRGYLRLRAVVEAAG